jgi:uncharacterized protein (TIGR03437 family)
MAIRRLWLLQAAGILLALSNSASAQFVAAPGGKGGFTAAAASPFAVGSEPVSLAVADFDGDGTPDIAIANYRSNNVTVLLGKLTVVQGKTTLSYTASSRSPFAVGSLPRSVAVRDFNKDGKPDLAVANYNDDDVTVLLNTFAATPVTVSAASYTPPVAPGSIVSIFGTGLASAESLATALPLPTNLGGTSVTITDFSGAKSVLPLFYAGPLQINAEIPPAAATGAATLTLSTPSGTQTGAVAVTAVAPGLFSANATGKGVALAQFVSNLVTGAPVPVFDCSLGVGNCTALPLDVSAGTSALVLYGTGIRNRGKLSDVTVTIGGQSLPGFYAGAVPNFTAEDQVNVSLPSSLVHGGTVYVTVSVAGTASNQVTVYLQ